MNILITGASRGIGKAIAAAFAGAGHSLLLTSRNEVALYRCLEELQLLYPSVRIRARAFDLGAREGALACGQWAIQEGLPDVLVNNAGRFQPGNIGEEPNGQLEQQLAVNLYSAYHLTRQLLPGMKERRSGHIFNICSIASLQAYPNGGAYSISKHALLGFSRNLREELKPFLVKVTTVMPGAVFTDSWEGFDNRDARIMEASDVAAMVLAAASLSPAACVEDLVMRPRLGDL
jgi:short-subunit dehydrogenase